MTLRLNTTIALCFLSVAMVLAVSKVPKEFQLCKRSSPDFVECIKPALENTMKSIRGGIKELGIHVLDPLFVPSIAIVGNGRGTDLSQYYEDCLTMGMTNGRLLDFASAFDKNNCYFHFKTFNDAITMTGKYRVTGKLLLFQLNGHGHTNITLVNLVAWHNATCGFFEKDGFEFINITNWVEDYHPEKVLFDFDHLVDGNAELSAEVLKVINENNLEIYQTVQYDFEKLYATIFRSLANIVFSKIPWQELFLD